MFTQLSILSLIAVAPGIGQSYPCPLDTLARMAVCGKLAGDAAVGVKDGGVLAATEVATDRRKAGVGELAGQVHGDLACQRDLRAAVLRHQRFRRDVERGGAHGLDVAERGGCARFAGAQVTQDVASELGRGLAAVKRRVGDYAHERSLECPDARGDAPRDLRHGLRRYLGTLVEACALLEDR